MPTEEIFTLVGNYGFPMICCILLFRLYHTTVSDQTKALQKLIELVEDVKLMITVQGGEKK